MCQYFVFICKAVYVHLCLCVPSTDGPPIFNGRRVCMEEIHSHNYIIDLLCYHAALFSSSHLHMHAAHTNTHTKHLLYVCRKKKNNKKGSINNKDAITHPSMLQVITASAGTCAAYTHMHVCIKGSSVSVHFYRTETEHEVLSSHQSTPECYFVF